MCSIGGFPFDTDSQCLVLSQVREIRGSVGRHSRRCLVKESCVCACVCDAEYMVYGAVNSITGYSCLCRRYSKLYIETMHAALHCNELLMQVMTPSKVSYQRQNWSIMSEITMRHGLKMALDDVIGTKTKYMLLRM
jgi:hypothetical protein